MHERRREFILQILGSNSHINGSIIIKVHLQRWQCIDVMLLKNSLQKVFIAFFVGSPCKTGSPCKPNLQERLVPSARSPCRVTSQGD